MKCGTVRSFTPWKCYKAALFLLEKHLFNIYQHSIASIHLRIPLCLYSFILPFTCPFICPVLRSSSCVYAFAHPSTYLSVQASIIHLSTHPLSVVHSSVQSSLHTFTVFLCICTPPILPTQPTTHPSHKLAESLLCHQPQAGPWDEGMPETQSLSSKCCSPSLKGAWPVPSSCPRSSQDTVCWGGTLLEPMPGGSPPHAPHATSPGLLSPLLSCLSPPVPPAPRTCSPSAWLLGGSSFLQT